MVTPVDVGCDRSHSAPKGLKPGRRVWVASSDADQKCAVGSYLLKGLVEISPSRQNPCSDGREEEGFCHFR